MASWLTRMLQKAASGVLGRLSCPHTPRTIPCAGEPLALLDEPFEHSSMLSKGPCVVLTANFLTWYHLESSFTLGIGV